MPEVCPQCGAYALNNKERSADSLSCDECGVRTAANILPLFIVTGASGSGKSAVVGELRGRLAECVVFDSDLLWGRVAEGQYHNDWVRIAYSIAQGGRHTVICGTLMPHDMDAAEDRGLVGTIHYLNLHANDATRERRLRARPAWRNAGSDEFIASHKSFAQWLLDNAATAFDPPLVSVDTSNAAVGETADAVAAWVLQIIGPEVVKPAVPEAASA